jgi:integrase
VVPPRHPTTLIRRGSRIYGAFIRHPASGIRPALRKAGLPERFRTYDLRHSHASVMTDLGVK